MINCTTCKYGKEIVQKLISESDSIFDAVEEFDSACDKCPHKYSDECWYKDREYGKPEER